MCHWIVGWAGGDPAWGGAWPCVQGGHKMGGPGVTVLPGGGPGGTHSPDPLWLHPGPWCRHEAPPQHDVSNASPCAELYSSWHNVVLCCNTSAWAKAAGIVVYWNWLVGLVITDTHQWAGLSSLHLRVMTIHWVVGVRCGLASIRVLGRLAGKWCST